MAPRKPAAEEQAPAEDAAVEASEEQAPEFVDLTGVDLSGTVGIQDGALASTAGPTGNGYTDEQEDAIREAITGPGWEPS